MNRSSGVRAGNFTLLPCDSLRNGVFGIALLIDGVASMLTIVSLSLLGSSIQIWGAWELSVLT